MTLVVEHPDIATPTGIDVDEEGKVWAVACHTHMPPDDYAGPKFDQVLVFDPSSQDDRTHGRRVFYEATFHTMDLELGADGWVYLAERGRVLRIRDSDGDGRADVEEELATLSTGADYPHNGLSGLAWHPNGDLCFGLGENFAKPWTLTAMDGTSASGVGEGGVFRMSPDGTKLHRTARGLWNPFGLVVRSDGEMFAAENDPGERPPCRLLHVVDGGDYGYQRAYGPAAHHPFVGWNGELRGTLPMIHPSGEGPCGVAVLGNGLIVPSWSDHRIDFFALRAQGASYSAERMALMHGGRYFRPVCIAEYEAAASAGKRVWYLTDWVDGRYPVHGYGRLWRLELDLEAAAPWLGEMELRPLTETARRAARLRDGSGEAERGELFVAARDQDPCVARAALLALSRQATGWQAGEIPGEDALHALLALKLTHDGDVAARWLPHFLGSEDEAVRFEALRWIADARLGDFSDEVDTMLSRGGDLSFKMFEAALAAKNTLAGKPEAGIFDAEELLNRILDDNTAPRIRAYALRIAVSKPRTHPKPGVPPSLRYPRGLPTEVLVEMLDVGDPDLSLEIVRTLAGNPVPAQDILQKLAGDTAQPTPLRIEAIIGLAAVGEKNVALLIDLAADRDLAIAEEALRALRSIALQPAQVAEVKKATAQRPLLKESADAVVSPGSLAAGRPALTEVAAWQARLDAVEGDADVDNGRRLFHHPRLALCANCHRHEGRGSVVGPDLSRVSGRGDPGNLLESILNPNAEIAPEYLPRTVTFKDGTVFTGIRLRSSTREAMRDASGRSVNFDRDDIVEMEELQVSFMPTGLPLMLTDSELRDLLEFLKSGS